MSNSPTPDWNDSTRIAGVDVDAVAAAVRTVPGVSELGSSSPGAVATYLPGRRVLGIRVEPELLTLEVKAHWGVSADQLFSSIRRAVSPLADGRRIHIVITDIE